MDDCMTDYLTKERWWMIDPDCPRGLVTTFCVPKQEVVSTNKHKIIS